MRRRALLAAALVVLGALATAPDTGAAPRPRPCALIQASEAARILGAAVEKVPGGATACTLRYDRRGKANAVIVNITPHRLRSSCCDIERILAAERALGAGTRVTLVRGLGDPAFTIESTTSCRSGQVKPLTLYARRGAWLIVLQANEPPATIATLQRLARIVRGRLPE